MKSKKVVLFTFVFFLFWSGSVFSQSKSFQGSLNNWNMLKTSASLRVVEIQYLSKGEYQAQMVNILNALGKANIKEPVLVLLNITKTNGPVSLGKYIPTGYVVIKGRRRHIYGVEPTTFPTIEPSVWKKFKLSVAPEKFKNQTLEGVLIFKNKDRKVMATIATKLILQTKK